MSQTVIKVRRFKVGYEIRTTRVTGADAMHGKPFDMKQAYTPDGKYIGSPRSAYFLIVKRGIKPDVIRGNKVCSVGFCERDQKWYGWSHRAIFGFGVGSRVKKGDCHAEHIKPGTTARTLAQAKQFAVAFARSVS
jgi:hypothetical protein